MSSASEYRGQLQQICEGLPRGPLHQAISEIDQQIAALSGAMDGTNNDELEALRARLIGEREALSGSLHGLIQIGDGLQDEAAKL